MTRPSRGRDTVVSPCASQTIEGISIFEMRLLPIVASIVARSMYKSNRSLLIKLTWDPSRIGKYEGTVVQPLATSSRSDAQK